MKNASLTLNVILLVAVAVLYFLQFSKPTAAGPSGSGATGDLRMAYINSDTVLKYYDFFKANRDKLEAKGKQLETELKGRANSLQGEIESYQRNANNLTIGQARAVEEDLAKKRNNLQVYQENLSQQMMIEQQNLTKELYDKVTGFLREYGTANGLQIVFKFDSNSDVMFAGDSMDISLEVVKGLNEAYRLEEAAPAKQDSTATKK